MDTARLFPGAPSTARKSRLRASIMATKRCRHARMSTDIVDVAIVLVVVGIVVDTDDM